MREFSECQNVWSRCNLVCNRTDNENEMKRERRNLKPGNLLDPARGARMIGFQGFLQRKTRFHVFAVEKGLKRVCLERGKIDWQKEFCLQTHSEGYAINIGPADECFILSSL